MSEASEDKDPLIEVFLDALTPDTEEDSRFVQQMSEPDEVRRAVREAVADGVKAEEEIVNIKKDLEEVGAKGKIARHLIEKALRTVAEVEPEYSKGV